MEKDQASLQKKLQAEVDLYKAAHKDYTKFVQQRQMLDAQLNENRCVLEELKLLKPTNTVYKLFGPVLVKQDLEESRQNVAKRMEYIEKEMKRCVESLESVDKKQDQRRENIQKLQQQFQVAAAMK